jgi:hypothetical protein
MSTLKLSVTIDREVAEGLQAHVPPRYVSRFVNVAIRHELERERTRELLQYLEKELGAPDPDLVREAEAAFERAAAGRAAPVKPRRKTRSR